MTHKEISEISELLTEYSCSDIKAVVKEACMEPLREYKKQDLLEIKQESIRAIKKSDLLKAIESVPPSLKKKDLMYYKEFENKNKI